MKRDSAMSRNRETKPSSPEARELEAIEALESGIDLAFADMDETASNGGTEEAATLVLAELTAAIWSTIQGLEFEAQRLRREMAAMGAESLSEKRVYH